MLYLVKLICYSVILSSVKLEFSACITLTQEENNIIASKPMRLVCDIGTIITTAVTVRSPDNIPVVSCTPTIIFPPAVAKCTSSGVYTGSINETTNTVIVTTNTLPGDVNGTWSCTHGSSVATIPFPNPIPCLVSESFVLSPSSLAANVTSDTTAFSLIATFSCFNVDVSFKWILKAGTSHEFTSSSVSKDSSSCTDSGTCTGVNAYTQTISSDSLFQFATAQSLKGGFELSAEAHYSSGIIALKSHSIGYFEFSQSTDSCDCNYWTCIGIILACVSISSIVCTVVLIWRRKQIEQKAQKIIRCSEKLKWNCCCTSTPIVLHVAVLFILTIITLVIWLISMLFVIFLCCAGKECEVKGTVIGISLALSLVVILICSVVFWITCCCADRGCRRVEVECGNKITLLDDFKKPDGEIKEVEWIHEGNIIVSSENTAGGTIDTPPLTLQMVSLNQSGEYVCIIKYVSEGENEEKVFRLNLIVLQQPPHQVNSCERVVLLEKLKSSTKVISVVWTLDGIPVPTTNSIYKGGTTEIPALTILNVSTADTGLYECKLTLDQGQIRKYRSMLKVNEQPPKKVNLCDRVVLLKKLKSSTKVISVVWTHDRIPVPTTNCIYKGGTTEIPALTILIVSTDDSGMYECKLTVDQGQIRKYRFKLKVNEQLIQHVNSGERVVLLDKLASLNAVTSVVWTHDRKPVPQNNCMYEDGNTGSPALTIPIVSPENSGMYECKITLNQGLIRKYGVMLKVNVPKIKKRVGERVMLLNNLKCPQQINVVEWYINGSKVEAQTDSVKYQGGLKDSPSLLVGSLGKSDSGRYRCDLIISDLQIILQIPVDLEVEPEENTGTLRPLRISNRVYPTIQN